MSHDLAAFSASVDRYSNLPPDQRPPVVFHGWDAKAWRAGVKYIEAELKKHTGATVRAFTGLREDGLPELLHAVADKDGKIVGWFNESFPCPPRCQ